MISSIKLDGTRCLSIDFLSWFFNNLTDRYLNETAIIVIGFFDFEALIKLSNVAGVLTIFSCSTQLGNGWKYHRSWYIINFLDLCEDKALMGNQPIRLIVLWYRTILGLNFLTTLLSLIASTKFRIAKNNQKYLINWPNFQFGICAP